MTLIYKSNQIFGQNNFPWLSLTRHYIFFKFPDFPWLSLTFQTFGDFDMIFPDFPVCIHPDVFTKPCLDVVLICWFSVKSFRHISVPLKDRSPLKSCKNAHIRCFTMIQIYWRYNSIFPLNPNYCYSEFVTQTLLLPNKEIVIKLSLPGGKMFASNCILMM